MDWPDTPLAAEGSSAVPLVAIATEESRGGSGYPASAPSGLPVLSDSESSSDEDEEAASAEATAPSVEARIHSGVAAKLPSVKQVECSFLKASQDAPQFVEECVLSRVRWTKETYPQSCKLHCAWDHYPFNGKPWFAVKRKCGNGTIMLEAKAFCSPGCRNAWLHQFASPGTRGLQIEHSHQMDLSLGMRRHDQMRPFAPSPQLLADLGGSMSLEDFRAMAHGRHLSHMRLPGRYAVLEGYGEFLVNMHVANHICVQKMLRSERATREVAAMYEQAGVFLGEEEEEDETELTTMVTSMTTEEKDQAIEDEANDAVRQMLQESISTAMRDKALREKARDEGESELTDEERYRLGKIRDKRSRSRREAEHRQQQSITDAQRKGTANPRWSADKAQRLGAVQQYGDAAKAVAEVEMAAGGTAVNDNLHTFDREEMHESVMRLGMELSRLKDEHATASSSSSSDPSSSSSGLGGGDGPDAGRAPSPASGAGR